MRVATRPSDCCSRSFLRVCGQVCGLKNRVGHGLIWFDVKSWHSLCKAFQLYMHILSIFYVCVQSSDNNFPEVAFGTLVAWYGLNSFLKPEASLAALRFLPPTYSSKALLFASRVKSCKEPTLLNLLRPLARPLARRALFVSRPPPRGGDRLLERSSARVLERPFPQLTSPNSQLTALEPGPGRPWHSTHTFCVEKLSPATAAK